MAGGHVLAKYDLTKMTVKFVSPKSCLSDMPIRSIPASSLKMDSHFEFMEEWDNVTQDLLEKVTAEIKKVVFGSNHLLYTVAVTKCKFNIYDSLQRLLKRFADKDRYSITTVIRNEATLRYAIGDPLVNMLCDLEGLKVVLEESVSSGAEEGHVSTPRPPKSSGAASGGAEERERHPLVSTPRPPKSMKVEVEVVKPSPSSAVAKVPSLRSRCDYSCYTLRLDSQVLAIVIEAKMSDERQDAIAQVMGYVAAFMKVNVCPPIAIVLTQSHVDLLLFPFVTTNNEALLRAAIIKFDFWKNFPTSLHSQVFYVIAGLVNTNARENIKINVAARGNWEMMRCIKAVSTVEEDLQRQLRERDEEVRKQQNQLRELREQIKELREQLDPTT